MKNTIANKPLQIEVLEQVGYMKQINKKRQKNGEKSQKKPDVFS